MSKSRIAAALALLTVVLAAFVLIAGRQAAANVGSPDLTEAVDRVAIPMPTLHIEYTAAGGARLSGRVPDQVERDALVRQARAIYGQTQVTDALETGGVANPSWLGPAFLPDLRAASNAHATLHDARLDVDGMAATAAALSTLTQSLASIAERGIRIDNRLKLRPPAH